STALMPSPILQPGPSVTDPFLPDAGRRRFVAGLVAAPLFAGAWPGNAAVHAAAIPELRGTDFVLDIGLQTVNFTGQTRPAITINNSLPAPVLRWREGDTVTLRVNNRLRDAMT